MNEVQRAANQDDFARGIAVFRALAEPTPLDHRWAGICLMYEGQYPEAELRLRHAVTHGDAAGAIFLASLHLLKRQAPQALLDLDSLDPEALPVNESALWFWARAQVGWRLGEHRDQLFGYGHQAWERATDAPVRTQVAVATLLGKLLGHFGEPEQALAYLDFAAENGQPRQQEYVALCRVGALVALGRFDEGKQQLSLIHSPVTELLREMERVTLLSMNQEWAAARTALLDLLPRTTQAPAQEVRIRTALLVLAVAERDDAQAQHQLLRAEQLAQDPYERFLLDHRAGQWLCRQGCAEGLVRLRRAAEGLAQSGHLALAVAVYLALAEYEVGQRAVHLQQAARLAAQLGTPPLLAPEWALAPQSHQHLLAQPQGTFERLMLLGRDSSLVLRLCTLGQSELIAVGGRIIFRLARTVELLSYLARNLDVTLGDIQRDLFPDVPLHRAKNYFHQARVDLAARVPGLEIHFDAAYKRYRLNGRVTLIWDVDELEQSLRQGNWPDTVLSTAEFLPDSDSEWVYKERERLSRWITQVGLETMDGWFQAGQFEKCIYLAERLLPLDPLDEGLHSFLLNATCQIKGQLAARHLYQQSAATFMREVGEIPATIQAVAQQWSQLN